MTERRHDIDALRVFAFALLILYHVGMAYVAGWDFHLKSAYTTDWLQAPMIALNRWRMPLLFMISGIAIGLARAERAPWQFAWRRCGRLLAPLLFGMFVVVAVQAYCQGVSNGKVVPGFGNFLLRYWQVRPWPAGSFDGWEHGITWNHLWYLAYLLPYTLLLMAVVALGHMLPVSLRALPASIALPALLLAPILWEAFCLLWVMPRHPPTHALVGDWFVHAESFPLFVLGYALAHHARFWTWSVQLRWPTLIAALLAIATELSIRHLGRSLDPMQLPALLATVRWDVVERLARATYTWLALLTLFGWARHGLNRPFAWLPYCTQAVFPWYILHQSLIILALYWLAPLHLGPWLEPSLVLASTVAGCLLLHEYLIRRVRWLRPLFGMPMRESPTRVRATATLTQV
ncbi:acyltransferase family protein [Xanthomonas sp. WHRI 10064A]|uniref:acyltransferase family protein n=1 Tax=unclassified Xanthomonas TaxID=2643310 RepID=UPI002B22BEDD|nr:MULTISPECIES: acyltransferase family protein [unclassified Xanthomonas]MEA9589794.1 acyltransferase family protein [Xanthomonas sp. WHRI 10064B]MEA9617320.1 acyltransferase family protein [Xanthomonas sp. WHRI 10064A]